MKEARPESLSIQLVRVSLHQIKTQNQKLSTDEGNLAALVGDVQSPLGPQEQQEEGRSEVQHGTQIEDQESN